ncbi:uncharacterized protein LOC129245418 [Anastrepha obliqua]|uniref:uncharacterized protein LOC129245418 n=1 Tax=Anastrepha obliqua TaxID=95512 RepID=UPI0024092CEB|nr:uncharacterized protein LOC129245418 [Anastrepha obliqua]
MASGIYSKYTTYAILLLGVCALQNLTAAVDVVDPAVPRTCYTCEGINCLRITKLNATTECLDLVDYCVTIFRGFTVVARGCYADLQSSYREKCDLDDHPECVKCFGNLCNDKGRADFKCIECNSSENNKCAADTTAMTAVQCPIPTTQNSYCYVRQSSEGATTRGCFVHQREQQECLSDSQCSMCLSDDAVACNTYKLATSATSGTIGFSSASSSANIAFTVAFTLLISWSFQLNNKAE